MEVYAGAAVMGLLFGAVVGQATGRVVNSTLDLAVAGAGRAYGNLVAKDPSDPETSRVFEALATLDVNARLRMTNALVQSLEIQLKDASSTANNETGQDDPLVLCVEEVKHALGSIESSLIDIRVELEAHQERVLHRWRMSNVGSLIKLLESRLNVLDKRLDMLARCRAVQASKPLS